MKINFLEILCIFVIIAILIIAVSKKIGINTSSTTPRDSAVKIENYIDSIWPNKVSMYNDYYTRSNGSIYGNTCQPWNLFSGYPSYPKAY